MIETTPNQSPTHSQMRVAKLAGLSALILPVGLAGFIDWSVLETGPMYFAVAQLGVLSIAIGLFALAVWTATTIGIVGKLRNRMWGTMAGVGLIVFTGLRCLTGFDGVFGQAALNLVQLLSLGIMLLTAGYVLELVAALRAQLDLAESTGESGDREVTS